MPALWLDGFTHHAATDYYTILPHIPAFYHCASSGFPPPAVCPTFFALLFFLPHYLTGLTCGLPPPRTHTATPTYTPSSPLPVAGGTPALRFKHTPQLLPTPCTYRTFAYRHLQVIWTTLAMLTWLGPFITDFTLPTHTTAPYAGSYRRFGCRTLPVRCCSVSTFWHARTHTYAPAFPALTLLLPPLPVAGWTTLVLDSAILPRTHLYHCRTLHHHTRPTAHHCWHHASAACTPRYR